MKHLLHSAVIAAIVASVLLGPRANARPLQGSIDFGGVVTFGDSSGADTMSLTSATRVNLWNSSFVLQDSGDFSSIAAGTNVTMAAPWIFNPSTATPSLWSVSGFTFDLTSSVIVSQTSTFLNITGIGTMSGNGFDPTAGTWSFTSSDSNGSPQSTFGFQTQSSAVPEPAAISLFGFGIVGIIARRILRRERSAR
jgi:hypothetical protein